MSQERPKDAPDGDVEMKENVDENNVDAGDDAGQDEPHDLYQIISDLSKYLCSVEENGEELAAGFQRIPNRRLLPDYFDIISEPVAFSTIRQYTAFAEFVKDVAQICHNAQVYNRPSAPIFGAAERLREIFQEELKKLVDSGDITAEDARLPDLGELPPVEESPSQQSEDEDEQDERMKGTGNDDDDDEEDEDEDSDEDSDDEDYKGRNGRRRTSDRASRANGKDAKFQQKRGRPPMVLTPTEARIFSVLKELRKIKDADGNPLAAPFDRLPDKAIVPDYYQIISNPIALDNIKKKAKRKKYQSVDQALSDLELMFENAKLYNEDGSPVYEAAVKLQQQARVLAEQEKLKPDDDFRDEDGKLPLSSIEYNGETWRVGDWVHIRNPNDLAKPIVAQIFRTWQDREGQKWINACWYYRPEQTVHRFEKHFYEREVVKTGQYRDHPIADVIDRCYVMFVTRFNRGRPRGLAPDKEIYVCESRYNEEKFYFNKIKTWASCLPDEVRDKDYEMDLFDVPRPMKKIPSPIKHLLRDDAKETDELPRPTWGSPNAPPIIGAVHRRPPGPNVSRIRPESPPPESMMPTMPAHPKIPAEPMQRLPMNPGVKDATSEAARNGAMPYAMVGAVPPPGQYYGHHHTPHFQPVPPSAGPSIPQTPVPIPHPPQQTPPPHMSMRPLQYQQYQPPQPAYMQNYNPGYAPSPVLPMHHQPAPMPRPTGYMQGHNAAIPRPPGVGTPGMPQAHGNMYNPPRPPEVYTLPDNINETLPPAVRQAFQHDEAGRVLFFAAAPLDRSTKGLSPLSSGLGHSAKYLAGRGKWLAERERKRKERDEQLTALRQKLRRTEQQPDESPVVSQAARALELFFQNLSQDTERLKNDVGL
ncbi:Bromodomain-containing protein [Trichoderma reesei RUT C-30]|uniref:Bromodomain-containing protein n=1 Tax=Hypocrea jecorina (strain ATCC 56765 / BCRC 32924 / NRRL 11460 / Rut C-30) TaxID=1344414 RepID=A0A024SL73_HYPJR|nr:Bromodomain-containing protein [Trichoderma reesei RUT C-30]